MLKKGLRMLSWIVMGLLVAFFVFAIWVRVAPTDAAAWHVDPVTAPDTGRPNMARVDRVVAGAPAEVAQAIAALAEEEGAERIAGDALFGTWMVRTALMRYPDYVSIRLLPEGDGTRVQAFSRSRFGYGDAGVNRARLRRWLPE